MSKLKAGLLLVVSALLLMGGFSAVQFTQAQAILPDECYDIEYETRTSTFNGIPVERRVEVNRRLRDECKAVPDGRINEADNYAAARLYCTEAGVAIWDVDTISRGEFSFLVTFEEIAEVPLNPAENTLIKEHGGFRVYRLTSGELQLNSPPDWEGKQYVFIWDGCPVS